MIELPTSKVYLYTKEGNPNGEIVYPLKVRGDSDLNDLATIPEQAKQGDSDNKTGSFEDGSEESLKEGDESSATGGEE